MHYNIKGTGLPVSDEIRTYIEKRLSSTEKFLDQAVRVDVEVVHNTELGQPYRAEFTLESEGVVYRAEASRESLHEAIDVAAGELLAELRRSKKKHLHLVRRGAAKFKDIVRGFTDRF